MVSAGVVNSWLNSLKGSINKIGIKINTSPATVIKVTANVGNIEHNSTEKFYDFLTSGVFDVGNYTNNSIIQWILYDSNEVPLVWDTCSKSLSDITQIEVKVTIKGRYNDY